MNEQIRALLDDTGRWLMLPCPRWLALVGFMLGIVLTALAR